MTAIVGIQQLVLVALLVEAIVNNLKPIYDPTKGWQVDRILTLIIAIVVCVAVGSDIFSLVELPMAVPYLGSVLTGIVVSRGANFVHELIKSLQVLRTSWQTSSRSTYVQ